MKKIYIAGCGGMLGEAFYQQFRNHYIIKCTDKDVNEVWLSFLDFRDCEAYRKDVFDFNPDFLFHLGAYTDLEFCEENSDDTYHTNIDENTCGANPDLSKIYFAYRPCRSLKIIFCYQRIL